MAQINIPSMVCQDQDVSAIKSCLLTTSDRSKITIFSFGANITKLMQNISLTGEHKKKKNPPKDPIGQLFAGMEKTMGDIVHCNIMESTVPSNIQMYGVYFVSSEDTCEVYRTDVKINADTVIRKGSTKLGVCDAINRVLYQLISKK